MFAIVINENNQKLIRVRLTDCTCRGMFETFNCAFSYDGGENCAHIKYGDFHISESSNFDIVASLEEIDSVDGEIVENTEGLKTFLVTKNICHDKRLKILAEGPIIVPTYEDKLAQLTAKYNNKH